MSVTFRRMRFVQKQGKRNKKKQLKTNNTELSRKLDIIKYELEDRLTKGKEIAKKGGETSKSTTT